MIFSTGGTSWRLHIVTVKAEATVITSPKTSELISASSCLNPCVQCSQISHPTLAIPNQHLSQEEVPSTPRSLQKLPLPVFALFSCSLVPLSKHCSRSRLHTPRQGALLPPAPFSLYLVLSFFTNKISMESADFDLQRPCCS